jgi:hypothetical protein
MRQALTNSIRIPKNSLSPAARKWVRGILTDYEIPDHQVRLLLLAAEMIDRGEAAKTILKEKGLTLTDKNGNERPRPEVSIERNCSVTFARLVRELRLEDGPDEFRMPRM